MPEGDTVPPPPPADAGAARAAAGAAQRSALHLQAPGRSRPCRAAAGRRAREGRGGMKIAAVDSDLDQGSVHLRRRADRLWRAQLDDQQHPAGKVQTDTGITGWGEAFCYGCTDAVRAALQSMIAPIVIGRDARDIARLSLRAAADAASVRPLRHHHLRAVRPRHRAVGHRRQGRQPAAASAAGRRGRRPRCRPMRACSSIAIPNGSRRGPSRRSSEGYHVHQAARDRGGRGARRARGGGQRRADHGRHQLPVDAGAGAAHDPEAAAVRPALARGADLPARGFPGDRPAARRDRRGDGGGREQLHGLPVPRHARRPTPSTMRSPASPRWAASPSS